MGAISNIGYAVTVFGATLYLQLVRSLSPLTAGVVFLAPAVLIALSGPLGARLGKHFRTQDVVRPERAGEAAGVLLTGLVTAGGIGVAAAASAIAVLESSGTRLTTPSMARCG
jgi:hypothetical protein